MSSSGSNQTAARRLMTEYKQLTAGGKHHLVGLSFCGFNWSHIHLHCHSTHTQVHLMACLQQVMFLKNVQPFLPLPTKYWVIFSTPNGTCFSSVHLHINENASLLKARSPKLTSSLGRLLSAVRRIHHLWVFSRVRSPSRINEIAKLSQKRIITVFERIGRWCLCGEAHIRMFPPNLKHTLEDRSNIFFHTSSAQGLPAVAIQNEIRTPTLSSQ